MPTHGHSVSGLADDWPGCRRVILFHSPHTAKQGAMINEAVEVQYFEYLKQKISDIFSRGRINR